MPANTSVWTFEQLGGPRKTLTLSDHAAPHGRPRKKPVVERELEVRMDRVWLAGDGPPVTHIFGTELGPFKLEGRFSDGYGGAGFARAKLNEVNDFVMDVQAVRVTWDDIVSVTGIIKHWKPGIESGGEVTWEMVLEVDEDHLLERGFGRAGHEFDDLKSPAHFTNDIRQALADMHKLTEVPGMRGSIFDSMNSLISSVNSVSSSLATIAGQIDSFANAPFQLLRRFRGALVQFTTVVARLRKTYDDLQVNVALENEDANYQQIFWDRQAGWSASSLRAIQLALKADRSAALAEQGRTLAIYTARQGDTWERISRLLFNGSSGRAEDIRNANGALPGSAPVPGTAYTIPR